MTVPPLDTDGETTWVMEGGGLWPVPVTWPLTTKGPMMDRPDLHELDRTTTDIHDALEVLERTLEEAGYAADGEIEDDKLIPDTGNGDIPELFEEAARLAFDAKKATAGVRRLIATQQGFRDFEREPVA